MNLDEAIARTKEASESQRLGELGRETALQLAAWLEELKQYKEEKQETNLDHFKHEILECGALNLAIVNGMPKPCNKSNCHDCKFFDDNTTECYRRAAEWLKQPYKDPAIKLTQFEYDLLQSFLKGHPFKYQLKNINALTEMRKKGYFKGIDMDATLEDILVNCEITEEN